MAKATYQEVCAAVDSEREYQEQSVTKDPARHDPAVDDRHTVGNYCTMLQHYSNVMMRAVDADVLLHQVRKIAGIAVRCMEEHGFLLRHPDESVTAIATPTRSEIYLSLTSTTLQDEYVTRTSIDGVVDPHLKRPEDYRRNLRSLQSELVAAWTLNPGHEKALELLPHIAYTAMHCMAWCGALPRVWQKPAVAP